ncbi:MAG TPA: RodZ domain-containing protein [Pseudoxanthomonas sp.]|nr:RodZ domain-containing protein [Pseudoxanthomonas sp.]
MNDQIQLDPHAAGQYAQGCGAVLRIAREKASLSLADAASQLKMPGRVLKALEEENWQQLGAPVFVRGQLRSYARLLKVEIEPYLEQAQMQPVRPAELVSHSHTPRYQRVMESVARRAVYVVITAAIAIPVWVATQSHVGENPLGATASLDVVPLAATAVNQDASRSQPQVASAVSTSPYVASLTPLPRASANALTLHMIGDSWVQVIAQDGSNLEKGLLKAGEERSFHKGQVGRVVLGNAAAVEVQQAGSTVDMTPYKRANVARFAVSSEGSLTPVAD